MASKITPPRRWAAHSRNRRHNYGHAAPAANGHYVPDPGNSKTGLHRDSDFYLQQRYLRNRIPALRLLEWIPEASRFTQRQIANASDRMPAIVDAVYPAGFRNITDDVGRPADRYTTMPNLLSLDITPACYQSDEVTVWRQKTIAARLALMNLVLIGAVDPSTAAEGLLPEVQLIKMMGPRRYIKKDTTSIYSASGAFGTTTVNFIPYNDRSFFSAAIANTPRESAMRAMRPKSSDQPDAEHSITTINLPKDNMNPDIVSSLSLIIASTTFECARFATGRFV